MTEKKPQKIRFTGGGVRVTKVNVPLVRPEPKPPEVTKVRIVRPAEPEPGPDEPVRVVREPEPPAQPPQPLPAKQQARLREHARADREKIARQRHRNRNAEIVDLDE